MAKSLKKRKSFTLIEILIVVFFSTIIIIAAYAIYTISYKSYKRNSTSSEMTQNARIALERMSRDIRQGSEILTVLPEDQSFGSGASELKFQDGHTIVPIQYITFYLSGTDLHRKISHYAFSATPSEWVLWSAHDSGGNPPTETTTEDVVKAQDITNLQFWGTKLIIIDLNVSDGSSTYSFETKSLGRNVQ